MDVRLRRKVNSNSHDARLVHPIITMIRWIRTSRLSMNNSLSRVGAEAMTSMGVSGARKVDVRLPKVDSNK